MLEQEKKEKEAENRKNKFSDSLEVQVELRKK
jgi:hypothetical protein